MEEIKVNEYIKTKEGSIDKVTEIANNYVLLKSKITISEYGESRIFIKKSDIVKHSPNIIDLLQEGDYIQLEDRGERFYEVTTDYQGKLAIIDIGWNEYEEIDETYNEDIKSIVTKEMFNQVKYEV